MTTALIVHPDMKAQLRAPRRMMAWMAWFANPSGDLYCWTGAHNIEWDGHLWYGLGHLIEVDAQRRASDIQYLDRKFTLNGLDPAVIVTDLLSDVSELPRKLWMAALDEAEQIVRNPVLMAQPKQDTIEWNLSDDGQTVSLTLNTYEALPYVGRATNECWSHESQLKEYADDVGLRYTLRIGQTTAPVDWQAP